MSLKFFNIDLHVSVIEDVKTIWKHLFPNIEIVDWSISGHAHLFNHAITSHNAVINQYTWRNFNMDMIHTFHNHYDHLLSQFDGFIITHTPIFVMLFEKYNKPIIIVNSCRYNQPLCWTKNAVMTYRFHDCLKRLCKKHLLTIIHNNLGDMMYFNKNILLEEGSQVYIPSLCSYVNAQYNPTKSTILVDDPQKIMGRDLLESPHYSTVYKTSPYEWKDLYEHVAIIVIPTEISYMTFFEYVQANIPLILPSKELLLQWIDEKKLVMGTLDNYNLSYSENIKEWIEFADYYTSPVSNNIIYFPSIPSLVDFLSNKSQLNHAIQQCHSQTSFTNTIRTHSIYESWNDIFHFNFFKFICYNFWPCLAKHHLDGDYSNEPECPILYKHNALDPKNVIKDDLIFVKTDLLPYFVGNLMTHITESFRIIIGVSDITPDPGLVTLLVNNKSCTKIISTNMMCEHPKIEYIPIGFPEPLRKNGDQVYLRSRMFHKVIDHGRKNIDVFIRKFGDTKHMRSDVLNNLGDMIHLKIFDSIVRLTFQVDFKELHSYLEKSKFAIVLPGNGIDTHYFYECILNECIPIFIAPLEKEFPLYRSFPCIQAWKGREMNIDMIKYYENIDWIDTKKRLLRGYYK